MNSFLSILGAALLATGTCVAAEPTHELAPQTAVKLINLLIEDRESTIEIAMIIEGTSQQGAFEAEHVRQVVAVHPVGEEGKRVRRMQCYDFQWSEHYGWFTWQKRQGRGGDEVWIWSELKGEVVVR